ncbi:MAG: alpha/beta hydrolase [Spirochaetaceae bacterium]|jgi:pimeloyl-ACP methyl ester carboxylesterase|nr:alpha/beta hydrolase [Spirochaetaceae bacterium]
MEVKTAESYTFGDLMVYEKTFERNSVEWRYTISGNGKKTLFAILSNFAGHLLAIPFAEELMETYRVIALSVPPVQRFSETAEGLKDILDIENITSCDVIGHSNGGVHFQNLISKYPQRINKIVFSHSFTSMDKNDAFTINASEIKVYKTMRRILKVFPASVLSFGLLAAANGALYLKSGKKDTKKLKVLVRDYMKKYSKKDFLDMAVCMEDFIFHYTFTTQYYANKPDNILIIDSPTDNLANPQQRAEMRRLCPGAREYQFKKGGHITLIKCRQEYISILKNFLGV